MFKGIMLLSLRIPPHFRTLVLVSKEVASKIIGYCGLQTDKYMVRYGQYKDSRNCLLLSKIIILSEYFF